MRVLTENPPIPFSSCLCLFPHTPFSVKYVFLLFFVAHSLYLVRTQKKITWMAVAKVGVPRVLIVPYVHGYRVLGNLWQSLGLRVQKGSKMNNPKGVTRESGNHSRTLDSKKKKAQINLKQPSL